MHAFLIMKRGQLLLTQKIIGLLPPLAAPSLMERKAQNGLGHDITQKKKNPEKFDSCYIM